MIGIVYSTLDEASLNMAEYIKSEHGFSEGKFNGRDCFTDGRFCIYKTEKLLVELEEADAYGLELIYFLSKHSSSKGIAALTAHATGNWTKEAKLGGKPYQLSVSAPVEMHAILKGLKNMGLEGVDVSYEATHHGPLIKTPSMFVEIGGNAETVGDVEIAAKVGEVVYKSVSGNLEEHFDKIAIGIGGTHYPRKFSDMALNKGYAFAHIMAKYAIEVGDTANNFYMIKQAFERSKEKPEIAVIDWKSMNGRIRDKVINELKEIGIDYERV
ncbi:MAG: D-aminoacyl-tRNA deacylase [Candidatus Micrarchaeia archaeon]